MHASKLLHTILNNTSGIGIQRLTGILACVDACLMQSDISISSIGEGLSGHAKVKNKRKRVDGLCSNGKLYVERKRYYKAIIDQLIGAQSQPCILVDWSPCITQENYMLRASLLCKTNSFVLYEEVYKNSSQNKASVVNHFLLTLAELLPATCQPIIVTDAGFSAETHQFTRSLSWDFVHRLRSSAHCCFQGEEQWFPSKEIKYFMKGEGPRYLGKIYLTQKHQIEAHVAIIKSKKSWPKNNFRNKLLPSKMKKDYSRSHKEPWVIITSLEGGEKILLRLANIYGARMKIEHEFRKIKNERLGLGLARSKTRCPQRLQILLLIGMLAMFIMFITGAAAEAKELQYHYQANTIKTHRVISVISLGKLVIHHNPQDVKLNLIKRVIREIGFVIFAQDD